MKWLALILFGTLALISSSVYSKDDEKNELEKLAEVTRNLPRAIRAEMIVQKYHVLYPSADLSRLGKKELELRFASADVATFYSHDDVIAGEMLDIYKLLRAKEVRRPEELSAVAGAQIISRSFSRLDGMQEIGPLPKEFNVPEIDNKVVEVNANWQILRPSAGKLIRDVYPIDQGKFVVVISNPLCGFSEAASKVIESDKDLSVFFSKHGLWLVPPARRLYDVDVIEWNKSHSSQKMVLAYKTNNWPIIDDWSTPIFYFLENGIVVDKIVGWPKNGQNLGQLRAAIERFTHRARKSSQGYEEEQLSSQGPSSAP